MKANQATYPVRVMSRLLGVSASGFYAWVQRPMSARAVEDIGLTALIHAIHRRSGGAYGAPSIQAELADDHQRRVGTKRVARLMRVASLRGLHLRRFVTTTIGDPAADRALDQVERQFTADGPDRLWVADITYVPTWAGFLYLAIVLDVWSRRIVGWAMEPHLKTELVLSALNMALAQRRPEAVIHHSDRGCQGRFNRSSQRLNDEELRWEHRNVDGHIVRDVLRCGRRGARRRDAVSTGADFGNQSLVACPAKRLRWLPACLSRSVLDGPAKVEACRRSAWPHCRGVICRLSSAKKLPFCTPSTSPFVTSVGESAAPRRPSRASYVAMRPPAMVGWSIARRPRSGTPT